MGGWSLVKLGDVCNKITDGSHNPPKGLSSETEYLMLSSKNINNDQLDYEGARFLSESSFKAENKRTYVQCGDVLLTIVGTVGRTVVVEKDHPKFTLQRSVAVVKPDDSVNSHFLAYALNSLPVKREMQRKAKGVAQKGIYLKDVKSLSVPLPPLEEQWRIVEILDAAQKLIDQRREQIALMDQLVQSLFYDMFGDPVTNPMGWESQPLGQICSLVNGRAFKPSEWEDVGLPIIRIQNLNDDARPYNYSSKQWPEKFRVKTNDILLSWSGTPGTSFGCFRWKGAEGWVNQHIFRVDVVPQVDSTFFIHSVNARLTEIISNAHGGVGLKHITKGKLEAVKLAIPPNNLQQDFAMKMAEIESQRSAMMAALKEMKDTFSALMQRAFKGEL